MSQIVWLVWKVDPENCTEEVVKVVDSKQKADAYMDNYYRDHDYTISIYGEMRIVE